MKLDFSTHKWIYSAVSALTIIFGVIFLFLPAKNVAAFTVLICILLLITSIVKIAFHFLVSDGLDKQGWALSDGIFELIIALLLLFSSAAILIIPGTVVGVWALFTSVNMIFYSLGMRSAGDKKCWICLTLGALAAIFSLFMLFSPNSTATVATLFVGLFMIVYGFSLFIGVISK